MARLAAAEDELAVYQSRFAFLSAYLERQPRLSPDDEMAFAPRSQALSLADCRLQLAELALALDETKQAHMQLRALADDKGLAAAAPLRSLTAAVVVRAEVPRSLWADAEDAARTAPLVELFCALLVAAAGEDAIGAGLAAEQPTVFRTAIGRARIPQLSPLLAPKRAPADEILLAQNVFVAMCADYAARLSSLRQMRKTDMSPPPWGTIDWPLLLFHLAAQRGGADVRIPADDDRPSIPLRVRAVNAFLSDVAAELEAAQ